MRAAHGSGSGWYGVARTSHQARISAGAASIVDTITDAEHRATTLRLVPRERR